MAAFSFYAWYSSLFAVSMGIFLQFNTKQSQPYMDEIFHVPQVQKYCDYKFDEWDPKITTLPGLYLISFACLRALAFLVGHELRVVCSTFFLRMVNTLFLMGNVWLLRQILFRLHCDKTRQSRKGDKPTAEEKTSPTKCSVTALVLALFPLLYFFTFLYYTDSSSTFFVLLLYYLSLRGNHFIAAFIGAASIVVRQTNVIWVVFTAGVTTIETLQPAGKETASSTFVTELKEYITSFYNNFFKVFKCLWAYGIVVACFAFFVVINGGIVVGDKSQHQARLNFPQLFYLLTFTLAFSSSQLLLPQDVANYLKTFQNTVKKPLYIIGLLLAALSMILIIYKFTYVHEYLLADNRHYPFYIWRKVYARHWLVKYALVPLYIFSAYCIHRQLSLTQPRTWLAMFYVCVSIVTVPQKLLEFRYFIIPYIFYRLHSPLGSYTRLALECTLYAAVNAITFYLFLEKPFHWAHSPKAVQRFMW
ncbi:putative Dol-P-Glc:Glc(2)Man(9)GlcNAc(2)-PP-Dol alpha-1,2-glucosyltransferase [Stylophora pistillata]|uniref:Dol-P-Glc:Glc(2)Man(9)GlcNAc(2)-PP-Dol alpha-1,2-glucosyltransferase n=1 Tax=Stylophora pistillata TaxID=50429 RepID=A0A2B4RPQ8_STYPI|nr:putative Dol-P-Glc:Glc(2)Man(9)GlcNAc(2)-PP-Dol alpha-1,2-glucosyltransferase [Stylophora pistillata]PFX18520.1 putative Dol-P-Glc:Glc(2)Man(9)GlcNAc(2)-PP-Dol alpha-1,2-glucosyltransferase [Stylophora pistillata]